MTYLPPLNGGRINATISGNTAGAGSLVSSGTLTLAGGNNITLSQAGNAITISGGAGGGIALANSQTTYNSGTANLAVAGGAMTIASTTGQSFNFSVPQTSSLSATGAFNISSNGNTISMGVPAFSVGMSTGGNTSGTTGTVSNQLIFAGGNNITLSQATATSGNTITISAASQTVQTQNLHNLSLSGNTSGVMAQVSSGTLTLAGGNNITLSQAGNAVTVSAANQTNQTVGLYGLGNTTQSSSTTLDARSLSFNGLGGASVGYSNGSIQISAPQTAAQTNQTVGLYGLGNTTQNSSTTLDARSLSFNGLGAASVGYSNGSIQLSVPTQTAQTQNMVSVGGSTGAIVFSNSNNVSFGGNASTITASASFSQTVQTQNLYNLSLTGNTAGVMAQVSSGTLTLAGGNNITLSQNGNAITISAGAAGGAAGSNTFGMSNLGNTSGTTGVISGSNLQFAFAGGNNITLSQSINASSATITISAASQTVQTQNMVSFGGSTGNIQVSNSNNVTFGAAGSIITASASFSQTNQNLSLYALGNTTQNSSTLLNASNLSFNGLGGASVGYSNGSIQLSVAPMLDVGVSNLGNTLGNTGPNTNGLVLVGGNNITLSQGTDANGATVTISGPSGGGGGVALGAGGTVYSTGTANLVAQGAMTIVSTTGQSYNISVPQTSSLSATGGVSIFTNGSTISIGAPAAGTISNWEPMPLQYGSLTNTQLGNASVYFFKLQPEAFVNASQMMQLVSVSVSSSSNSSHAGALSIAAGIFTASGSTLSLITQSSGSASYQWTNTSSNSMNSISGLRGLTMPLNINMSEGNYWLGVWSRSSTTNTNWFTASNMVFTDVNSGYMGVLGQASNATQGIQEGVGVYSATSSALPTNIAMSRITQSNLQTNAMPYIVFKNQTW